MSSILIKSLTLGGSLGVIGTAGATTYFLFSTTPISELLKANGKILLSETDEDSKWTTNWQNFKKEYPETKEPTDNWKIEGDWRVISKAGTIETKFKAKCTENSKIKVRNTRDTLYKEVESYCSKDKNA